MRGWPVGSLKGYLLGAMALGLIGFAFSYTHEQGYQEGLKQVNISKHKGHCWYCVVKPLKQIVNK